MADMPRPRLPYTHREVSRHGTIVWYFRRGKGKRTRLPGAYGSTEFRQAYDAALAGRAIEKADSAPKNSLQWLVDRYSESGRFSLLSPETQKMRRSILMIACKTGGKMNFRQITPDDIKRGKMRREATPYAAANYVKVMRALFKFAVDSTWITTNPADSVDSSMPRTDGHHTWTVEEVLRYQEKYPVGTQARLAMDLLLYTGMRRGDAVMLGRQHIRNGVITYRAIKTEVEVILPVLPALAASIAATKTGDMALLCTSKGEPWAKEAFGNWFRKQCVAAKVPGRAHGLRKAGATFAAENGATPKQLSAMFGWTDERMASIYTRRAERKMLAEQAANALSPHLESGAGPIGENVTKSKADF